MLAFLVRRGLFGALVVCMTAFFAYGMIRLLRPEEYGGGQPLLTGTWQDVDRQLLHLELGGPDIKELWLQGVWADLFLLAGGVLVAVAVGVAGGLWCAALFGASAPIMVTNMVLVEWVFAIPGFFRHMRRALGQNYGAPEQIIDVPMIQTLSMWAAVLIVALGLIGDLAIVKLDPRIRSAGRTVG